MNTFRRGASALISVSGRDCVAVPAVRAPLAPLRAKTAATSAAWLLFCLLFVSAFAARAATFDIAAGDVAGLKAAINTANANGEADTINLAANATYTLTTVDNTNQGPNGLPVIVEDGGNGLSINGNGASLVRSSVAGTPDFRILTVFYRASLNVSGLTLSGGSAVDLGEALSGFGGAINNLGTLTMTRSTVSNNFADVGGGIHSLNTLQLSACTIANNTADSQGGGLNLESSTGTLENCTISGNKVNSGRFAGGGGLLNVAFNGVTSTLTLDSCTINNNTAANAGAGISNFLYQGTPNTTYRNTIIAGNSGASNVFSNGGSITSLGYNISSDASGNLTQPTDKPNTDPRLAPLANNGGPTQTHALQSGSPAIDAGNTALTTDQRGFKRPSDIAGVANAQGGNGSDIGAYELDAPQSGTSFVVNQTTDTDDGSCGATDCTLREAINAANVAGGTITFDATVFASKQTIKLGSQLPNVTQTTTITGSAAGVTIDGAGNNIVFSYAPRLTLRTLNFINGGGDSVANFSGDMLVEGCAFFNHVRALVTRSTMTVRNTTLSGSGSTAIGLGNGATATLESCTLARNVQGIGAFPGGGTVNLSNSILAGNSQDNIDPNLTIGTNDNNVEEATLAAAGLDPAGIKDNGGPVLTIALVAGSRAIDKGTGAIATDARGLPRPVDLPGVSNGAGNGSDIGAFEKQDASGFASGPNFVVTNTGDTDNGCTATNCSLREAINAANGDGDTSEITFDATVFASKQTITIPNSDLPPLTSNLSIIGPTTQGAGVTVKGKSAQTALIFQIQSGVVSLSDLSLTTSNVAVTTTGGTTTVERCTVSNSVVCLYNTSSLTAQNCTLNSNGGLDGVLSQGGTTNIRNCTVTGNNVGIDSIQNSTVNVSNSLVVGNRNNVNGPINDEGFNILTGTAAQAGLGPLKDNGGPTQTFALLAGSPAIDMGSNALIPAGVTTDQRGPGYARIRGGVVDIGAYEVQNSAPVAASQSVSTLSGSPANITLNATDVNGDKLTYLVVAQPANGKVTIAGNIATYTSNAGYVGPDSFTFKANDGQLDSNTATVNINVVAGPAPPESGLVVTTLSDIQASDGVTSLREAVDAANRDGADSPITFAVSGTITLTGGELTLVNDGKVSITGPAKGITINGDGKSRVFNISSADATFNGLNITGGNSGNANGGGILNNGALTLNGSTLFNNTANSGGAIANGGALTLVNATLAGNSAQNNGGGIFNSPTATMTSLNSTIVGNAATSGGGIFKGKSLTLSNSIVVGNTGDNLSGVADAGGNNITAGTNAAAGLDAAGLKDNGGPVRTIALTTRGTAVNAGDNAAAASLKTDGRGAGFPRVVSSKVDIGAFESAFGNRAPALNNATFSTSANVPFSQQLAGSDADGDSLSYARAGGTLPAGVTLSPTGLLAGTPKVAGRYDFSVNVFDGTDTIVARFIIVVSDITDGVGPVITRAALGASYTRDEFANIVYRGTVRDVAPNGVTPSGVAQVTFQLRRNSDGFAYSGNETDGFTSNVNLGYFPAFLGAAVPDTTAGTRDFRRTFSADGFVPSASVLKPGGYSLVIVAKDNAGNYSVEVVPVAITAATAPASAMRRGGADVSGGNS